MDTLTAMAVLHNICIKVDGEVKREEIKESIDCLVEYNGVDIETAVVATGAANQLVQDCSSTEDFDSIVDQACTQISTMPTEVQANAVVDLMRIAQGDGEVAEQEAGYIGMIIEKLGLTIEPANS